ncbi:MAG: LarC family nickel insertion protein [Gammaproteobacteria bacterium]|nr:LarC family nickel insertion protein [Gammaproteobacteria bacterium]
MYIHLDPLGGVAGDMFISALLDAWPEQEKDMTAAIRQAGLPENIELKTLPHRDHAFRGLRFHVNGDGGHGHSHVHFREIRARLKKLPSGVGVRALAIYELLADAEGKVHGTSPEEVAFHEAGAWDSIADVAGAAFLINALNPEGWSCEALPMGSGRVSCAHGILPVPAPAVTSLLEGFPVFKDGLAGERITPTGAAILRYLNPDFNPLRSPMRLDRCGIGFGTRTFPGISNMLRALVFNSPEAACEEAICIEFEIDDQTPEDLAAGLERIRALSGVFDVTQGTVFGKKGRIMVQVRVLAARQALDLAAAACFTETSTIGLRWQKVQRMVLDRNMAHYVSGEQTIRVKYAQRLGGTVTGKAEIDDINQAEGGAAGRARLRYQAENAVLSRKHKDV